MESTPTLSVLPVEWGGVGYWFKKVLRLLRTSRAGVAAGVQVRAILSPSELRVPSLGPRSLPRSHIATGASAVLGPPGAAVGDTKCLHVRPSLAAKPWSLSPLRVRSEGSFLALC